MTTNLQSYLLIPYLPKHFTMHIFRVRLTQKSFAGMVVDEVMNIGGWKTESVAKYYIGAAPLVDKCRVSRIILARETRTLQGSTTVSRVQTILCGVCSKELNQLKEVLVSTPDQWPTTSTIKRRRNEVLAGPQASAENLVQSNTYIEWSKVKR